MNLHTRNAALRLGGRRHTLTLYAHPRVHKRYNPFIFSLAWLRLRSFPK